MLGAGVVGMEASLCSCDWLLLAIGDWFNPHSFSPLWRSESETGNSDPLIKGLVSFAVSPQIKCNQKLLH